jgi:acylphosphatase
MKKRVHITISGKVQGVFFRANTKQKADQLGLSGWVRNTPDGTVEAVFEGDAHSLDEMVRWCHHGPSLAQVQNVKVEQQQTSNRFDGFSIKY